MVRSPSGSASLASFMAFWFSRSSGDITSEWLRVRQQEGECRCAPSAGTVTKMIVEGNEMYCLTIFSTWLTTSSSAFGISPTARNRSNAQLILKQPPFRAMHTHAPGRSTNTRSVPSGSRIFTSTTVLLNLFTSGSAVWSVTCLISSRDIVLKRSLSRCGHRTAACARRIQSSTTSLEVSSGLNAVLMPSPRREIEQDHWSEDVRSVHSIGQLNGTVVSKGTSERHLHHNSRTAYTSPRHGGRLSMGWCPRALI